MSSLSSSSSRFTCEIVFHRATNVPIGDLNTLSSDPYILATLISLQHNKSRPEEPISFRTSTVRRTLNPEFDGARWIVSGVPASGFIIVLSLMDEDPGDHDDRLGKAVLRFPDPNRDIDAEKMELKLGWQTGEREYKIHKRHGGFRARFGTYVAKVVTRGRVGHRTRVMLSVRVLGEALPREHNEDIDKIYTLGPHVFARHFSPLAVRLTAVQSFKANQLQLAGPVPSVLRHRYVGFRPFVKAMFRARGIEGIVLNRALHKQHRAIYKWNKNTIWGIVADQNRDTESNDGDVREGAGPDGRQKPHDAFAKKFLEMAEYGTEGRVFTYVIMLDGQWRFTETGEEFAINLLSKHTMHSDVAIEIAYSGEFFVRRVHHAHSDREEQPNGDAIHESAREAEELNALPPSAYELVIDNDSGTYRPQKELLPVLEAFLARPENLGALGRVRVMDGFDEKLKKWKEQRKEEKRKAREKDGGNNAGKDDGRAGIVRQASMSSSSSSSSSEDEEAMTAAERDAEREKTRMGDNLEGARREDARRAADNEDDDPMAIKEQDASTAQPNGKRIE